MKNTNWTEPQKVTASHAWRRWAARMLDYLIYDFIIGVILVILSITGNSDSFIKYSATKILEFWGNTIPEGYIIRVYTIGILLVVAGILINSIFIYCFGNTLGKKIFGIKIVNLDNSDYNFSSLLKRELLVFQKGLFYGLPLLEELATYLSYKELVNTNSTIWDKQLNFKIIYRTQKSFITICTVLPMALCFGWAYWILYDKFLIRF
ncbi:RDD family protein [Rickettsia endosymbiont of Orchestes rusci]|uniref:RDD family protein n=1 Tax=Rickettsia endosymbiont of Orchestes rusci TaxID=3066250 RepID=UPI00313DF674